jgi:hypothetical protein
VQVAAIGGLDTGLDRIVGDRQQADRHPERGGDLGGDLRQRRPLPEPRGAVQVGGQVAVAQREPRLVPEAGQLLRDGGALVVASPLLLGVHHAGQPVGDRVEIRADAKAHPLQVVTDVHDRGDAIGREDGLQPPQEAGSTDAAGEHGGTHACLLDRFVAVPGAYEPDLASAASTRAGRGCSPSVPVPARSVLAQRALNARAYPDLHAPRTG